MPSSNDVVAATFDEIADLLEIGDANSFRIRAYRQAARQLRALERDVGAMVAAGEDLDALPGIGADLAAKIVEIVATGRSRQLLELRREALPGLTDLLQVPGLGPRRIALLHERLGIGSLAALESAARHGRLRTLERFGPRLEQQILEGVRTRMQAGRRMAWGDAFEIASDCLERLRSAPGVQRAEIAGSLRRRRETVGDIDLLVTAQAKSAAAARFTEDPAVDHVIARGTTRASVVLRGGLQADLRVVPASSFGAAWVYFTGSRAHNIALRRLAQAHGLKLNEYGLFQGETSLAGGTEQEVYAGLGLPWIEPELREDRGEVEAAAARSLPHLVTRSDLRGDLHSHTTDSDGLDSLEGMAEAARRRGLEYLAITDHSRGLGIAHGLDAGRLARQIDRIDALNATLKDVTLLKGVEVDILEDGSLDLPDDVLSRLDLVVGAIHRRFDLSAERQTARILRAMDSPCFTVLAHPSGRLLGERGQMDFDLRAVVRHARERGCFLELDAAPLRLDLDDAACRLAKEEGVLVSIDSDAHAGSQLDQLEGGVGQARRGWLSPADVLNSRGLLALRPLLDRTMNRSSSVSAL